MKLDNRHKIYQIWFRKFLSTIVLAVLIIIVGYGNYFKNPVLGLDKGWYLAAMAVIYIGLMLFNIFTKPNFVSFTDNGDKIVLRYYPTRIMNSKKNSIEIQKQNFVRWEVKKFFFGMYEMLFLYGKFKSGVAKYPGISLSALKKSDREKIKSTLQIYSLK